MGAHRQQRDHAEERRSAAPATALPALLHLQRQAGNRAVTAAVQRMVRAGALNIVGEIHDKHTGPPGAEQTFVRKLGLENWRENAFEHGGRRGDPPTLSAYQKVTFLHEAARDARRWVDETGERLCADPMDPTEVRAALRQLLETMPSTQLAMALYFDTASPEAEAGLRRACSALVRLTNRTHRQYVLDLHTQLSALDPEALLRTLEALDIDLLLVLGAAERALRPTVYKGVADRDRADEWGMLINQVSLQRSRYMLKRANEAARAGVRGVWKVGDSHVTEMRALASSLALHRDVEITSRAEFKDQLKGAEARSVS